jgi:signal transduction histidine kinase/ligand-binding sensor domain-containing protein/DNA-binding response OmpR family regulator
MRTHFLPLAICGFFIIRASLAAGDYKFNKIDASKGLSNSEIRCIYKDRTGFMWFGTPSGLNRYDGYEIITYKQNLVSSRHNTSNNDMQIIQEDALGRLWIKTRSGFCIYDPGTERFEDDVNPLFEKYSEAGDFWNSPEAVMYIDFGKNFWFVAPDGVRKYDVQGEKCIVFKQGEEGGIGRGIVRDIKQGQNRYWFLFDDGVLECMEAQSSKIIRRDSTLREAARLRNTRDLRLFIDSEGNVWVYGIGMHYGLACYNTTSGKWANYSTASPVRRRISNNVVSSVEEDDRGNIWIGTDHGGINLIDKATGDISVLRHDAQDGSSITEDAIKCIYRDDTGIMWIGTYKKGVCYYHESIYKFSVRREAADMPFPDVNCFYEAADRNLWLGTNGGGLLYFDRGRGRYVSHTHREGANSPAGDIIVSLAADREGRLWIGYYLAGLDRFDGSTFTHIGRGSDNPLNDNNAWVLRCDREGNMWVGTLNGGLVVLDAGSGERIKHFDTKGSVYSIIETMDGDMLVGSQSGLYIYNRERDGLDPYEKDTFDSIQLSRADINNLYEDSRGLLWIGTKNGLFVFNRYSMHVQAFTVESGLSSDMVQSILEDREHNMWIATNRGLTKVKVSTSAQKAGYFYNLTGYDSSDGLQGDMFNYNAAYLSSRSELIFGGSDGYNIFTATDIRYNHNAPRIRATDFSIYNQSLHPGQSYKGRVILRQSITKTREINLHYTDNYFTVAFAALDYCMPGRSRYYYKLEGFNAQWLETGNDSRKVTYTNLNPGSYTLFLKAVNNDGVESNEPLVIKINIAPPFWLTLWAWMAYGFLAVTGVAVGIWQLHRRSERKLSSARERMKVTQQLEMDEMKLRFFTNVSHDFRTPLTLILSPLDELLSRARDEEKELIGIIRRNATHLLTLVNQLLDFRRLDGGAPVLSESLGDITVFVGQQIELFEQGMARRGISITYNPDVDRLHMLFDAEKMSKALINILSNAYKFTPQGGSISVTLSQTDRSHIRIDITDTGIGIPEDELGRVFERFYQVRRGAADNNYQGSGIGLHISREFIALHGGEIWAERNHPQGSRFVITLPIRKGDITPAIPPALTEPLTDAICEPICDTICDGEDDAFDREFRLNNTNRLLIVEDSRELLDLIAARFAPLYTVLTATDGNGGLAVAVREMPDLILSDVMMPVMDGVEMSRRIKGDIRTSHIPIILLTAKTGEESKLEGLRAGADDYITKPFNQDILEVKVHNLIEATRRRREIIGRRIRIEPSRISVGSIDDRLIERAIEYTEINMADDRLSVRELSRELGMSRVQLYKKLLSLTGKTPIEFIRIIRLKRAAQLLADSSLSVSEIAYRVGFNNPKYFRKYFRDEFGVLPSRYSPGNPKDNN